MILGLWFAHTARYARDDSENDDSEAGTPYPPGYPRRPVWGIRKTLKEHTGGYSYDLIKIATVPTGLSPSRLLHSLAVVT